MRARIEFIIQDDGETIDLKIQTATIPELVRTGTKDDPVLYDLLTAITRVISRILKNKDLYRL